MKLTISIYCQLVLLSVSVFFCFSCTPAGVSNPVLQRADSLMECCADSALLLLQGIGRPQEMSKAEQMYYALLRTQAEDKNYIEHASDSLMKAVVEYYRKHGTTLQKMKSLYYLASVYRDLGDAPQAIDYFQQAAEVSEKQTEHELLSRIYSQMGTLFFFQKLNNEGVAAYRKSYHHTLMLGDSLRLVDGLNEMARIYTEKADVDSTLYYYKEAIGLAGRMREDEIVRGIRTELADIYLQLDELEEARALLPNNKEDGIDFINWGDWYKQSGEPDSAKYYYLKALETGGLRIKQSASWELYQIAKANEQPKKAIHYMEQYILLNDSVRAITDTEGVKRIESLYAYQHIKNENNRLLLKNVRKRNILYAVGSVALLFIGAGVWLFLSYRRRKNAQIEQSIRISFFKQQESQTEMEKRNKEIIELRQQLENAAAKSIQEITILKQQLEAATEKQNDLLAQKQQSENTFRASSVYQLLQENCRNPEFKMKGHWTELQEQIDAIYNNFTGRLYMICPRLSETELQISLLIKAEVPLKEIAHLLYKEKSAISNIRKRLYEKTHGKTGKAEQWDEFILSL